jgi:hypothetical protein
MIFDVVFANLDKVYPVAFLLAFSLFTRFSILVNEQLWARSFSSTLTIFLLPIVTFAITSVISGNIALSLGMIGALSIVRFRNPVRSSFELVIFFLMITLGICASVSLQWLVLLGITSNLIMLLAKILQVILKNYFNIEIYSYSFTEANHLSSLEVIATESLEFLFSSNKLVFFDNANDEFSYRLNALNSEELKLVVKELEGNQLIKSMTLNVY